MRADAHPETGELRQLAEAELARIRSDRTDPALLRWCEWPGCWRSFDAFTGPTDPGWRNHRQPRILLCPGHDTAGHQPGIGAWEPGDDHLTALCQCGATDEVRPTNHHAVTEWWTTHIQTLGAGK
jgi:hypothetical protein